MDLIMSWAKENFNLISLLVGIIGVFVAILSLIHEWREKKRRKKEDIFQKIKEKEAKLNALDSIHYGFEHTTMSDILAQKIVLQKEIEELEKML